MAHFSAFTRALCDAFTFLIAIIFDILAHFQIIHWPDLTLEIRLGLFQQQETPCSEHSHRYCHSNCPKTGQFYLLFCANYHRLATIRSGGRVKRSEHQ